MARSIRSFRDWPFVILLAMLSAFHLSTFAAVPFHPDEATQLYMSSDVNDLFTRPGALAWTPDNPDPRKIYHLLDAPVTRYVLGVGRSLAGLGAVPLDWDWGETWDENETAGALPTPELLWVGRLAIILLLPLSLTFLYRTGRAAGGRVAGLAAALLLGTNALVLVHGRRAMAEGALMLGVTFTLWSLLHGHKRPWLAGLAAALAFNAKQFGVALIPAGIVAVAWLPPQTLNRWRKIVVNWLQFGAVVALLTLVLNPVLWRYPFQAGEQMWLARQDLTGRQLADATLLVPEQVLTTPGKRALVLVANLYVLPPSFYEVGNYVDQTAPTEVVYMANPLHHLLRGVIGGGLYLTLTLVGVAMAILALRRERYPRRRTLALLLLATLFQLALMLATLHLPWQRFAIPLVPMVCLWAGYAVGRLALARLPSADV
jgi:4-amino-4-deoxy-L-arabinose transferase-like glycosyltransferase